MIEITKNNNNIIDYMCSCGTTGRCFFRALKESANIIVEIECPMCYNRESITLLTNAQSEDTSWALILSNNIE